MVAKPFHNIAISLSGGGYRATAFHLGALSYLKELDFDGENMLQRVKILSTISGGTLTGVMYALYAAKGRKFEDCYDKLYTLLSEDALLEKAFKKLNSTDNWKDKNKSKDLINAFSEVYQEDFFEDETFKVLFDENPSHLEDVIFGTTEFTHGIQFRFQEDIARGKFGNGKLTIPEKAAKEIRLGDAAAASSCFPGGFEPMIMPKDFTKNANSQLAKFWEEKVQQSTAIMDGGIVDNQGIKPIKIAEDRRKRALGEAFVGTFIISDVSGQAMKPYDPPKLKNTRGKDYITLKFLNYLFSFLTAFFVGTMIFCEYEAKWLTILSSIVLTICSIWLLLFLLIKKQFLKALHETLGRKNAPTLFDNFSIILETPIYVLIYLIKFRLTSVLEMVSNIFLRRIRSLQINDLFSDEDWYHRVQTNNIYALKHEKELGKKMEEVITSANEMPTTLWFSDAARKNQTLDKLIACGQFSLCHNLMDYIEKIQKGKAGKKIWTNLSPDDKTQLLELHTKLAADFELFKSNPLRLVQSKKAS